MEEKQRMFSHMSDEREGIVSGIVQLVYFMRGAIQYRDMMDMSLVERMAVSRFIERHLEHESKKMHPQY